MTWRLGRSVTSLLQLTSANVAVKILGLAMIAFYTRYLSKEDLAILPAYEMLAALSPIVLGFGLQPTLIRNLPAILQQDRDRARGMIFTAAALQLLGGTVFAAGVWLFAGRISPLLFKELDYAGLLRLAAAGFFFATARTVAHQALWADARFDRISVVQITTAGGRAVFGGSLVLLMGLPGLVLGLVLSDLVSSVLSFWFLRDLRQGPRVAWYPAGRLIRESRIFYLEGYLVYLRSQGDNWIVATMLGPAAMAVYFVAKRLPQVLRMFMDSLDKVITTEVSRRQTEIGEIERYVRRAFEINAHVVLPGILFLMGLVPAFIALLGGPAYAAAVVPCLVLCVARLLQTLNLPLGRAIFVARPPATRFMLTAIESAALILALAFLTPRLAEVGVALSRTLAGATALIATVTLLRRSLGIGLPWHQVGLSLVAALPMCALMLGMQERWDALAWVPLIAAMGGLVFLVIVNVTNAEAFYATLDAVLPFNVRPPARWRTRR